MRTRASLLILCAALAPSSFLAVNAQNDDQAARAELTEKLDAFIGGAIDKGLLEPGSQPQPVSEQPVEVAVQDASTDVEVVEAAEVLQPCASPEMLDFTDFTGMDSYIDLMAFREALSGEESLSEDERSIVLARAYISAGLSAEALMVLEGGEDPRKAVLKPLAMMLEGRGGGLDRNLRASAACYEDTQLWLAVALLSEDDPEGISVMRDRVSNFRRLPFQMRASVASIVVPSLARLDEPVLARRIMADFTETEITSAARLQFSQALLDFESGDEVAMLKVQSFLEQPSAQANAIQALSAQGQLPQMIDGQTPIEDLVNFVSGAANTREEILRLQVVIDTLLNAARHNELADLAREPAFDDPRKTDLIRRTLVDALEEDLSSASATRRLQAMDALVSDQGFIAASEDSPRVIQIGAARAETDGYDHLATKLYARLPHDSPHPDYGDAQAAFRDGDYKRVYELATAAPQSLTLAILAGQSALAQTDADRLASYEAALSGHPEYLIELIEADALAGHWLVGAASYDQVAGAHDEQLLQRLERVKAIKTAMNIAPSVKRAHPLLRANSILRQPVSAKPPALEETS